MCVCVSVSAWVSVSVYVYVCISYRPGHLCIAVRFLLLYCEYIHIENIRSCLPIVRFPCMMFVIENSMTHCADIYKHSSGNPVKYAEVIVVLCFVMVILSCLGDSQYQNDVIKWNSFCVTGPLWVESTGHRWIPVTKASDAALWSFRWYEPQEMVE